MADKTIGELKRATSLDDDSLMIAEQQGEAVSVTGGLFKSFAQESTKGFADSASADAATAVDAKNAAQSALKGVQDALDNLPAGSTLIINDLTTGGTTAALSAEMGKVLATRPNPNLLHNWYFANCVNQRGQTEYNGGYAIDRWFCYGTLLINDNHILMSEDGLIWQPIENAVKEALEGQTVTFSVYLLDGSTVSGSTVYHKAPEAEIWLVSNDVLILILDTDGNFYVKSRQQIGIRAAKLELGDTQTLAHQDENGNWVLNEIADYGEELAKCQRYQEALTSWVPSAFIVSDFIGFAIPTKSTMRVPPISILDSTKIELHSSGTVQSGFTFSHYGSGKDYILIRADKVGHGLTNALLIVNSGGIIADANL